jgi:hypothetical protein
VPLADLLRDLRRFDELPALAHGIGLEPAWHEIAIDALPGGAAPQPIGAAALIGRRDGFRCIAIETAGREAVVRRLARAMAARGNVGLVLGFDPAVRMLTIAVAAADCPLLSLDLARLTALDLKKLERGTMDATSGLARAMQWAEALSAEGLSTRFFHQFRRILVRTVESLPPEIPPRDRHAVALLQLTRVLFLYFVQDRGWLDGRPRFLREELDRRLGRRGRVHRRLLVPLFFGTLNRPAAERGRLARELGRIPFLNGGLFEPHALERRWRVDLPDLLWRDAFDELFERYHFTVAESADATAIGPDMLGRVFEGVMDADERRDTGAFYTPRALVDRMVAAAFDSWTDSVGSPAPSALRTVTVLDPAVGSGAFLLGALQQLVTWRVANGERGPLATRSVVTTNLFGVDRNPNAVRLAELRLWLEVIGSEANADPERIEPLPNLDAFVRQGDSLLEPCRARLGVPPLVAAAVLRHRQALALAAGRAKREEARELRRAELTAGRHAVAAAIGQAEQRIRELVELGKTRGLFGDRQRLDRAGVAELARLRAERTRLRRADRRIRDHDELPWFQYEAHFADVLARGGFDLVVGNPPWVRAETIPPADRAALKARYRWYRAGPSDRTGYAHQPDLAIAFLERALELVRPGGTVGFLLPSKLLTARYGTVARGALVRETTLAVVADLGREASAAFDATVYPMALVARRGPPPAGHRFRTGLAAEAANRLQAALGEAPWSADGDGGEPAAARHPTVADRFPCHLGVKTGADRIFLAPPPGCPDELLRPALRGRDVGAFEATPGSTLIWAHDERGQPLGRVPPPLAEYFTRHERTLRRRADYRSGPLGQLFRAKAAAAPHRVVWPDLARRLEAVALVGELERAIPLNTCYLIVTPSRAASLRLAAWLNATPIRAVARARATVAAAGFARFNAATVGSLPLPDAALSDDELLELAERGHRSEDVQPALDARVASLLGGPPVGPRPA